MQCAVTMQSNYHHTKEPLEARGQSQVERPRQASSRLGEGKGTYIEATPAQRSDKPLPRPSKPDLTAETRVRLQRASAIRMSPAHCERRPPEPVPRVESPAEARRKVKPKMAQLHRGGSVLDEMMLARAAAETTSVPEKPTPRPALTVRGPMQRSTSNPHIVGDLSDRPRPTPRRDPSPIVNGDRSERPPLICRRSPTPTSPTRPMEVDSSDDDGYIDPDEVCRAVQLPPARMRAPTSKPAMRVDSDGYLTTYCGAGVPLEVDGKPRRPPKRTASAPNQLQTHLSTPMHKPPSYIELSHEADEDDEDYFMPFDDGHALGTSCNRAQSTSPLTADEQAGYHILERPSSYEDPHRFGSSPRHSYTSADDDKDRDVTYTRPRQFTGGDMDDDDYEYNDPVAQEDVAVREVPMLDGEPTPWFHGAITRKEAETRLENATPGAYLVRIGEKHLGYSLSIRHSRGFRHYAIDQNREKKYELRGSKMIHKSVHTLILHYYHNPINAQMEMLRCPCTYYGAAPPAKR